ncbi:MAG: ribonuclease HIII [Candidatus Gastranaerophilales bacterium]|nr:ribonuclease HIII [Candidatus Gastranaerophilales bacterium]
MSNCFSSKYDLKKEPELKKKLESDGFKFFAMEHTFWRAQNNEVNVSLYKSGKILVQGKGTENFTEKYLNHIMPKETPKEAIQGVLLQTPPKLTYSSWVGTDESGKGDYFGPLVVAGVLVDKNNIAFLHELGVKDSKKLNDDNIERMAIKIKSKSIFSVVTINPAKYNELYAKFKNLNNLLAWGHARAIENILEKSDCKKVLSDKFGNESLIKNALMTKGKSIELEQRVRAEEDIAVAAASILARAEFVARIKKLSLDYKINFPKGASDKVKSQAKLFIQKYGFESLSKVAKIHFKTTSQVLHS